MIARYETAVNLPPITESIIFTSDNIFKFNYLLNDIIYGNKKKNVFGRGKGFSLINRDTAVSLSTKCSTHWFIVSGEWFVLQI